MAGHVFVARGDLTKLACDAWLLPTDQALQVESGWLRDVPEAVRALIDANRKLTDSSPDGWGNDGVRVRPLSEWPSVPDASRPWLVNVGAWVGMPAGWYIDGVRQFLDAVAGDLSGRPAAHGRAKPLVGLPLVGGAGGGAKAIRGEVARDVLGALREAVGRHDLDVALVTFSAESFAAAQAARRGGEAERHTDWGELGGLLGHAERLAQHAARGKLVLFLGAGLSKAAGLPDWESLLWELAEEAGLENEREALASLNVLDRAQIISGRLAGTRPSLGERIAKRMEREYYALGHALLASLPTDEAVTTNYDTLFESASRAAGHPVAVLPYEAALEQGRWLLKLHGSVDKPDDIVLTREDYLRYADRRAALAGIVQALLITRHMLFVGFSLTDDNFHRIVDDVRKALRSPSKTPQPTGRFGTALVLSHRTLWREFWKDDLEMISMAETDESPAEAARRLEIFLDYLVLRASSGAPHLLDDDFDGVLTDEERILRDALRAFEARVPGRVRRSPAWARVATLLEDLGGPAAGPGPARPEQAAP